MFKTIKAKMTAVTISMLFFIALIISVFIYFYYYNSKELVIYGCSRDIDAMVQNINKEVRSIKHNSKDLALLGEQFYNYGKNPDFLRTSLIKIFENYPNTLGGGVWFEPYKINKNLRKFCIYGYRNKDNKFIIDKEFETDFYNYLNRNWYKEIISIITDENNIEWSLPYYEKEGSDSLMITAGSGMYDNNGTLIGLSTVDWQINSILSDVEQLKVSPNSFVLFANPIKDYILVSTDPFLDNTNLFGKSLKNIPWYNTNLKKIRYITYHNQKYIPYVKILDNGMMIIVCIPKKELFYILDNQIKFLIFLLILGSFLVSALLYFELHYNILNPINKLTKIANKISSGDTDISIKIDKPEEFSKMANVFDNMTKNIKAITKEKEKINSELYIAKSIQESSLPAGFPPYPNIKEFDIYASMTAAKVVGGDFYDFYFIDDENFMFLVADVSGKGVPAALFMMNVKTLINNMSQTISDPKELIKQINNKICSNNKNNLFVTMLACIVNIKNGKTYFINCGHTPPLIKRNNGKYEYLRLNSNIVLGAFEDFDFEIYETVLGKNDTIITYTDGVTEAENSNSELYGEQRFIDFINKDNAVGIKDIIENTKQNLKDFAEGTTQSDDVTLLVFKYNGKLLKKEKFSDFAVVENYKKFYNWLNSYCERWSLSPELINKLELSAEEVFANVAFYAYPESKGLIDVSIEKTDNQIIIQYIDSGYFYNPLEKPDPDITLPPEEQQLGGLGIFMLKQMVDEIYYERINDKNILTTKYNI